MLRGRDNGTRILQAARDIEQAKEDAVGTNPDEIVEIARHAPTVVNRCQFGPIHIWDVRMDGLVDGSGVLEMEESAHRKSSREGTTELGQKPVKKRCPRCAHKGIIGRKGGEFSGKVT